MDHESLITAARLHESDFSSVMSSAFEMTVPVLPSDIDEQNHVNNTVYLRWVQDVATAHWQALASAEAQAAIGWVVLRHEIDYKTPATLDDEIVLRTWVGKATRLTFERFTEIRARVIARSCHKPAPCGAPSICRTGGRCACRRKYMLNFPPESGVFLYPLNLNCDQSRDRERTTSV